MILKSSNGVLQFSATVVGEVLALDESDIYFQRDALGVVNRLEKAGLLLFSIWSVVSPYVFLVLVRPSLIRQTVPVFREVAADLVRFAHHTAVERVEWFEKLIMKSLLPGDPPITSRLATPCCRQQCTSSPSTLPFGAI